MPLKLKNVTDLGRLRKMQRKEYRDGYLDVKVKAGIAYQMKAIRKKLGLSQAAMAEKLGMKQSVVSRLEDIDRGNVNVGTLLGIAKRLNIALVVKFVDYQEFLDRYRDMSEIALQPKSIDETLEALSRGRETAATIPNFRVFFGKSLNQSKHLLTLPGSGREDQQEGRVRLSGSHTLENTGSWRPKAKEGNREFSE